jgi:hypothetical protein
MSIFIQPQQTIKIQTCAELMQLACVDPSQLPALQTGDLIFASGHALLSKVIQHLTDSAWSHLGMVVRLGDELLVLDCYALTGARLLPFDTFIGKHETLSGYAGLLAIARYAGISALQRNMIQQFARRQVGLGFAYTGLIDVAYRMWKDKPTPPEMSNVQKPKTRLLCSELVYACFAHAGITLHVDQRGFISPASIWQSEQLYLLGRVR